MRRVVVLLTTLAPMLVRSAQLCVNLEKFCEDWARRGECVTNTKHMLQRCSQACGICDAPVAANLAHDDTAADSDSCEAERDDTDNLPPRGVIVYLAQNRRHPLYGSQGRSNLEKSLRLLHEHYNRVQRHDVLIFHEGDFDEADQASVISSALAACGR